MPPVTRLNDYCTGHDACPPMPQITGSDDVYVNVRPCGRLRDLYATHGCISHLPHNDFEIAGARTVYVNKRPIERIGDEVSLGGVVRDGSDDVYAGEWENGLRRAFTYTTNGKGKKTAPPPPFPVTDGETGESVDPERYAIESEQWLSRAVTYTKRGSGKTADSLLEFPAPGEIAGKAFDPMAHAKGGTQKQSNKWLMMQKLLFEAERASNPVP